MTGKTRKTFKAIIKAAARPTHKHISECDYELPIPLKATGAWTNTDQLPDIGDSLLIKFTGKTKRCSYSYEYELEVKKFVWKSSYELIIYVGDYAEQAK